MPPVRRSRRRNASEAIDEPIVQSGGNVIDFDSIIRASNIIPPDVLSNSTSDVNVTTRPNYNENNSMESNVCGVNNLFPQVFDQESPVQGCGGGPSNIFIELDVLVTKYLVISRFPSGIKYGKANM